VGLELGFTAAWLVFYALVGHGVGGLTGHPWAGLLVGVALGFPPSVRLGQSGHYDWYPAWIGPIALVVHAVVPKPFRPVFGLSVCALPWLSLAAAWVRESKTGLALHRAAEEGREQRLERLLAGGRDANERDDQGRTPLHLAANSDRIAAVRMLLDAGADPDLTDRYGRTPLHLAALGGYPEAATLLLEHGADTGIREHEGRTPLALAEATAGYWNAGPRKEQAVEVLRKAGVGAGPDVGVDRADNLEAGSIICPSRND